MPIPLIICILIETNRKQNRIAMECQINTIPKNNEKSRQLNTTQPPLPLPRPPSGEDNMLSDQPYRYLTVDEMKSLGDDSLPIDVTRDERIDSNRMMTHSAEYAGGVGGQPQQQAIAEELISPHKAQVHGAGKSIVDGIYMGNGYHDEQKYVG